MKKSAIGFAVIIIALLIGIAVIDAGAKRPVDWSKTYNIRDKIPFGLYIFQQELPNILAGQREFHSSGDSYYDHIGRLDSLGDYNVAIMDVQNSESLYGEDLDKTLDFVKNGGEVFISSGLYGALLDTLGIAVDYLSYYKFYPTDDNVSYSLVGSDEEIFLQKNDNYMIFSKLVPQTCTILGYLHADGYDLPNFISVQHGKGKFYFHLLPLIYTNYNMLQEDHYHYVVSSLNVVKNKGIHTVDIYAYWDEPRTPLRVILGMQGFSQAWYLLLFGLLLLMIFKSRREQRAVEVVVPEPNLSKDFAKTIGALYYESGQPGNVIRKKIDYFLYDIRNLFHVETLDLTNRKTVSTLALKSGVHIDEVGDLIQLLNRYSQKNEFTLEDVKMINHKIEDFKQKANMI